MKSRKTSGYNNYGPNLNWRRSKQGKRDEHINIFLKMWPTLLVCMVCCYVLPLVSKYFGNEILLIQYTIPGICLISSFVYGIRNGFQLLFSILAGVLILPSIFLYYDTTAWAYAIAYTAIILIGNSLGSSFAKRKQL